MTLIIIGADGKPHKATPEELRLHEEAEAQRQSDGIMRHLRDMADLKADRVWLKKMSKADKTPKHTRSSYAVALATGRAGYRRPLTLEELTGPIGAMPMALASESSLTTFQPRLKYSDFTRYDVTVVYRDKLKRKRTRMVRRDFKQCCEEATCKKKSCARCWAIWICDEIKPNEVIRIVERIIPTQQKVSDPSGVNPQGARKTKAQDMSDEQRAPYRLTSTIHSQKPGASDWQ